MHLAKSHGDKEFFLCPSIYDYCIEHKCDKPSTFSDALKSQIKSREEVEILIIISNTYKKDLSYAKVRVCA